MAYADDVRYASENLIQLIADEENRLRALQEQLQSEEQKSALFDWDYRTSEMSDDFPDVYVQNAHLNYVQAAAEAGRIRSEVAKLQGAITDHEAATLALCGALLQIAKQGISIGYGALGAAPDGRLIGRCTLKSVIWQGRNQAIHFEDNSFSQSVVAVFKALEADFGARFSLHQNPHTNLAREVVDLLGWTDYPSFEVDLRSVSK